MDFYHVLLPFATADFFGSVRSGDGMPEVLRRTFDVCGIRLVAGASFGDFVNRLRHGRFNHLSELYSQLEYADGPAWKARARPYEPDPQLLARASKAFQEAKAEPSVLGDERDNISTGSWEELYQQGKPGLFVYCQNHREAIWALTPRDRGWIIRCFVDRIHDACLDAAAVPEYPRLLRSLRIPADDWPPEGEPPFGLLKRFTRDIAIQDRPFRIEDPLAWWASNEAELPDLSP